MTPAEVFADAVQAACLLAVDPAGLGGMAVRAQAGPVRDRFTATLPNRRRLPAGIADDALLGGLDLGATLQAGRPVRTRGLLAEAPGCTLVAAMAERMSAGLAARLCAAMDEGGGFALVLLDEGVGEDERVSAALLDRLAFHIDFSEISHRDARVRSATPDLVTARSALPGIGIEDGVLESLCNAALALGISSPRAPLLALRAARASAARAGRTAATLEDAALAARLVLSPRATVLPGETAPEKPAEPPPEPPPGGEDTAQDISGLSEATEIVLEAARAALPADLLARLQSSAGPGAQKQGGAGQKRRGIARGRPVGARPGMPGAGARLNLIETLRAAAPWQRLRTRPPGGGPALRREDFRIVRTEAPDRSTTIFLVDASGSSAINRLAEAKGAVELLLADCYRRRDEVAVISFRGQGAQLLLPPTRSLVRARRSLAGLPGGGGTPLAAGLDAGVAMAELVRRAGGDADYRAADGWARQRHAGGRARPRGGPRRGGRRVPARSPGRFRGPGAGHGATARAGGGGAGGQHGRALRADALSQRRRAFERHPGDRLRAPAGWAAATNWPNRDHSRFVRAGGVDWHVQQAGAGPALLLVHGTGASTHSWRDVFPALAERFTVVAPDLPGHGFSEVGGRHALSLPSMARDLGALLRELGVAPALVAGHSAGAPILARMCLDGSIAPAGLVSFNGAFLPLGGPAGQVFAPLARLLVGLPVLPQLFAWRASDPAVVRRLLTGTGSQLDAQGVALYTQLVRNPGHAAAALRMMASWDLPPLVRDLPRLAPRLLLVAGEGDLAIPPGDAARVAELVHGARVVTWPGLGHLAHEEQADKAVALVEEFARELGVL